MDARQNNSGLKVSYLSMMYGSDLYVSSFYDFFEKR